MRNSSGSTMTEDRSLQTASPPPVMPLMGMIVDRTSFDETDDYGVDHDALAEEWAKQQGQLPAAPPAVMRNGKVRRRMRWRPKNMMKRRRPDMLTKSSRASSGSASVISSGNTSHAKSVHSFASTETPVLNNTKQAQKISKRSPLPRPNYPDTFAGRATIGSEAGFIHARMGKNSNSAAVFRAADLEASTDQDTSGETSEDAFDPYGKEKPPRKAGFPPLFNQRKQRRKGSGIPRSGGAANASPEQTLERTVKDLLVTPSPPRTESTASSRESAGGSAPLPSLSSEDLEMERRVDLRIRRPSSERRESLGSARQDQSGRTTVKSMALTTTDLEQFMDPRKPVDPPGSVSPTRTSKSKDLSVNTSVEVEQTGAVLSLSYSTPDSPRINRSAVSDIAAPLSLATTPRRGTQVDSYEPKPGTPSRQRDQEINFRMDVPVALEDERTPPSPHSFGNAKKPYTGPVDVDEACFLEVEKNLEAIHEMATEHLYHGEYTEALEVFEEILRGQLARYGQDHYRVGTALHNIGIVHMKRCDYVSAAKVCKEAVRVRKIAHDPFHSEVAVSLAQLGVAYMEMDKHAKAVTVFREALKIRRRCYGPKHPKTAKILNNIGCALYELNELEVAKVAFEEALSVQRGILRGTQIESPEASDQALLSIASTLSNLGSIKLYWGLHQEAAVDLDEVLLIQQSVLGDDHPVVQRTMESLTWVENARSQDPNAKFTLAQLSGFLSNKASLSPGAPGFLTRDSTLPEHQTRARLCVPSDSLVPDDLDKGSTFRNLERRLKTLQLDFGCGDLPFSDDESAVSSAASSSVHDVSR